MRPYYTDYVRHALRFYVKHFKESTPSERVPQSFKSEADKSNWLACHKVLKALPENERRVLARLYGTPENFVSRVYETCRTEGGTPEELWDRIRRIERKIARRRGLL